MKQHLEEEDLILHYYGETGTAAEPHLSDCPACRDRYQSLQRVLNSVEGAPVPHRDGEYEDAVWNRLAPKLEQRRRRSAWFNPAWFNPAWFAPRRWAPVALAMALLVVVFFAGRYSPRTEQTAVTTGVEAVPNDRERVLLVAVGDHLQRSKMLLIEIANADPNAALLFADGRETAQDLVYANRLYRQTAITTGDARVVALLDDLERVLIEMAHGPDELRDANLEALRERIKREGLIFKIRVAGTRLAQEETL
jgi:hypothetical protein